MNGAGAALSDAAAVFCSGQVELVAQDFQQAYDMLKKEKTAGKVYFQFSDGSSIGNIIDMTTMANGTIVLFRYNSSQGIKFQIVKIEDILTLQY